MTGIKATLLLVLLAMLLRTALFYAGVVIAPFGFILVQLLLIILAVFFSGHFLLDRDPSRGAGELMRAGFQSVVVYALLVTAFTWVFYRFIDTSAFSIYNEKLVTGFVEQGHPEALAREKVGGMYNAGTYSLITFFGLFMAGSFNALLFALVHDKLLRRFRK